MENMQTHVKIVAILHIVLGSLSILDAMRIPPSSDAAEGVDAALSDRLGWL